MLFLTFKKDSNDQNHSLVFLHPSKKKSPQQNFAFLLLNGGNFPHITKHYFEKSAQLGAAAKETRWFFINEFRSSKFTFGKFLIRFLITF